MNGLIYERVSEYACDCLGLYGTYRLCTRLTGHVGDCYDMYETSMMILRLKRHLPDLRTGYVSDWQNVHVTVMICMILILINIYIRNQYLGVPSKPIAVPLPSKNVGRWV